MAPTDAGARKVPSLRGGEADAAIQPLDRHAAPRLAMTRWVTGDVRAGNVRTGNVEAGAGR